MLMEILIVATIGALASLNREASADSKEVGDEEETDWDKEFDKGLGLIDLGDE